MVSGVLAGKGKCETQRKEVPRQTGLAARDLSAVALNGASLIPAHRANQLASDNTQPQKDSLAGSGITEKEQRKIVD